MKRGTIEHPKVAVLAMRLDLPLLTTIGLLEALWHWTARYCPDGGIGRYTDEAIVAGIHWDSSLGNPRKVIPALTSVKGENRFLDPCKECRLGVHDWHEHADEAVRKYLSRNGQTFWNGVVPAWRKPVETLSRHCRDTVETKKKRSEKEKVSKEKGTREKEKVIRPMGESSFQLEAESRKKESDQITRRAIPQAGRSFKVWTPAEFRESVLKANHDKMLTDDEVEEFIEYWHQKSGSGREKYKLQQTWDTRLRMKTAERIVFSRQRSYNGRAESGVDRARQLGFK